MVAAPADAPLLDDLPLAVRRGLTDARLVDDRLVLGARIERIEGLAWVTGIDARCDAAFPIECDLTLATATSQRHVFRRADVVATMRPSALRLWTALWIVYLVWGSTYLAIRVMVRTLPPLLSGGLRFVLAGALLAGWLASRGSSLRISPRELAASALLGAMLLTGGVGVVTVAETDIASSLAAIIASSVPLQVVLLRTLAGDRPPRLTLASVVVGLAGVASRSAWCPAAAPSRPPSGWR